MLLLFVVFISSILLSEHTLEKLSQSDYFQSKITQVLEESHIHSDGLVAIKFNKFNNADIRIEKANVSGVSDIIGHEIILKVDFIKYWLGLTFIDEVSIMKVTYSSPTNLGLDLYGMSGLDMKFLNQSIDDPLNKINSKSIYIEKGTLNLQNQIYDFNNIYIKKNEKLLTAKADLKVRSNNEEITFSASINLSLNKANIIRFNVNSQVSKINDVFTIFEAPKLTRLLLDKLTENASLTEKKRSELKLEGAFDLNSSFLNFQIYDPNNRFKVVSSIEILELLENNRLLFGETELILGDYSLFVSNLNFDFFKRTFVTNVTKLLLPYKNEPIFSNKVKVFGVFPFEEKIKYKMSVLGENPSNLNVNLKILEPTRGSKGEDASFDFFLKVDALQKFSLNNFGTSLDFIPNAENIAISLSNANAHVALNFRDHNVKLNFFEGQIDNINLFEINRPLVELENIDLKGNIKQGYVAISSVTNVEPIKKIYRDIKVEFSSTGNIEKEREITLSFKSKISDIISLATKKNNSSTWINFLARSQGEKEVSVMYSKKIALSKVEKFFTPEDNMFELNVKNFLIPISAQNNINLGTLNLRGVGNTIFFDGVLSANNKKISGSINNWLSNVSGEGKANNLIVFFDDLDSETFLPDFSTFKVKGPLKLSFFPVEEDGNILIRSNIDLTEANVYIPALALKKKRGRYGQLQLNFTKENKSNFKYSQNNVLVSGTSLHKSIFAIKKVNYSMIKTPDVRIERATFEKFGEYNQFKTNKGTISLDFLMRLRLKKKDIPLDLIFSNIVVKLKKNTFLSSLSGEIRSFAGLRGYAKAKLLPKSNLEITISPKESNGINLVISGNDAGKLLRRGKFYENGYGGMFKASILYKNKTKMSGSLEIENFRVKNAPVLAQIISSASIIGLLDNLNGNGLLFTKIEGSFDYKDGKLTLKDGVAVGPSLGLTMVGYEQYGEKQNTVNVNGLISPVYIINGVVKAIPLIGKVLGGEKGEGVFGVAYKVQGNSRNPKVLVNPLSILTPGVFRKIFRFEENGKR